MARAAIPCLVPQISPWALLKYFGLPSLWYIAVAIGDSSTSGLKRLLFTSFEGNSLIITIMDSVSSSSILMGETLAWQLKTFPKCSNTKFFVSTSPLFFLRAFFNPSRKNHCEKWIESVSTLFPMAITDWILVNSVIFVFQAKTS